MKRKIMKEDIKIRKNSLIVSFGEKSNIIISRFLSDVEQRYVLIGKSGNVKLGKLATRISEVKNFLDYNYEELLRGVEFIRIFINVKSIGSYKATLFLCRICLVEKIKYKLCVFYSNKDKNIKSFINYFETQPCAFCCVDNERSNYHFVKKNMQELNGID